MNLNTQQVQETTIAYKVTKYQPDSGNYVSSMACGELQCLYKIGEITEANSVMLKHGYGITVFKTLQDAESFVRVNNIQLAAIVRIEVLKEDSLPLPKKRFYLINKVSTISEFFDWYSHPLTSLGYTVSWPKNTLVYKKVKVLELAINYIADNTMEAK
jgi:hypothetical protein